mgnify:CR=1 FL=1
MAPRSVGLASEFSERCGRTQPERCAEVPHRPHLRLVHRFLTAECGRSSGQVPDREGAAQPVNHPLRFYRYTSELASVVKTPSV